MKGKEKLYFCRKIIWTASLFVAKQDDDYDLLVSFSWMLFDDDAVVLVDVDVDVVVVAGLHDDVGFSLDLIIAGNWMSDNGSNAAAVSALLLGLVFFPTKEISKCRIIDIDGVEFFFAS